MELINDEPAIQQSPLQMAQAIGSRGNNLTGTDIWGGSGCRNQHAFIRYYNNCDNDADANASPSPT